jgi:hypothetical protein
MNRYPFKLMGHRLTNQARKLLLQGMENALTQEWETCPPIPHAFEEFESIDMPLNDPVVPVVGQSGFHCLIVLTQSRDKTMQFRTGASENLLHPVIKTFCAMVMNHLLELLDELVESSEIGTVTKDGFQIVSLLRLEISWGA